MEPILDTIQKRLVNAYQPTAIYLFGSRAWGDPDEDSDFDLLIIVPDSRESPSERSFLGYRALRGLGIPKDILVYTKKEFEEIGRHPTSLCHRVKQEGLKLYDA